MKIIIKINFLLIIIFLLTINSFTQDYIVDRNVKLQDKDIYNDELLILKARISGYGLSNRILNYNKDYKIEGLKLVATEIKYNSTIFPQKKKIDHYNLTFNFRIDDNFTGKLELLPLEIWFIDKKNPNDIIATSTSRKTVNISSAYVRDVIIAFIFAVILLIVLLFLTIVIIRFTRYLIFKYKKEKKIEDVDLADLFYKKYQELRNKSIKKDRKLIADDIRKILTTYILQKFNLKNLKKFYELDNYDENIKNEIKKYLNYLNRISFSKERISLEQLNEIEDNMKTLLFII